MGFGQLDWENAQARPAGGKAEMTLRPLRPAVSRQLRFKEECSLWLSSICPGLKSVFITWFQSFFGLNARIILVSMRHGFL